MPKRRRRIEETPFDPGERQRCRFPDQWSRISLEQSRIDADRAKCLIEGKPINWSDVWGWK